MFLCYLFMLLCLSHPFYSILNYFAALFLASWLKCSVNDLQNFKKSIREKKAPDSIFTFRNCQRHFCLIQSCYKQLWQGYRKLSTNVLCSVMADSATPWTVARQAPLLMEFSRQEYWSRLLFPSWGDMTDPGIRPISCISYSGKSVLYQLSHWGNPKRWA